MPNNGLDPGSRSASPALQIAIAVLIVVALVLLYYVPPASFNLHLVYGNF